MSTRSDFFLRPHADDGQTRRCPARDGERMGRLIAFPLLRRYAVQPRPDAMPLQLRVVATTMKLLGSSGLKLLPSSG